MELRVPLPQCLLCLGCWSSNRKAACHLLAVWCHYFQQLSLTSVKAFLFELVGPVLSSCWKAPGSARRFAAYFEWPM